MRTKLWFIAALVLVGVLQTYGQCKTIVTIFDIGGNEVQRIENYMGVITVDPPGCIPGNTEYTLSLTYQCGNDQQCQHIPSFGAFFYGSSLVATTDNPDGTRTILVSGSTNGTSTIGLSNTGIQNCDNSVFKGSILLCPIDDGDPCPDPNNPDCGQNSDCDVPLESCLEYKVLDCCDMYCIKFNVKCPEACEDKCPCPDCYFVTVLLEDGSVASLNLNFANDEYLMNCYSQKIRKVLSITPYECTGGCPPEAKKNMTGAPKVGQQDIKQENRIQVSPNPAKTTLSFKGKQLQNYKMSIYDDHGHEVMGKVSISGNVNIEKLKRGIYIYVITDMTGYKETGKIIKE